MNTSRLPPTSFPDTSAAEFIPSDVGILDLLRKRDSMTVSELAELLDVTATAVRQRLTRLLAQGHIQRAASKSGRGRPSHFYTLTDKGRRQTGSNFADLAIALWQEIRQIKDPEVRRGLLQRIARRLAEQYGDSIRGETLEEKMNSLVETFAQRRIPFTVQLSDGQSDGQSDGRSCELPVLVALACPYPELAESDRTVCSMERMLFSELLGEHVRLTRCRLDGENCCTFETPTAETPAAETPAAEGASTEAPSVEMCTPTKSVQT